MIKTIGLILLAGLVVIHSIMLDILIRRLKKDEETIGFLVGYVARNERNKKC